MFVSVSVVFDSKLLLLTLCIGPNQRYVVKLYAVNSKGNGLDIQTIIETSPGKGNRSGCMHL